MIKHGNPPYLECSSKGDKRFSAFFAKSKNGEYIEKQYQAFKIFKDGSTNLSWKEAKGKQAINQEDANFYYEQLWREYINDNPELLVVLQQATGLSDMFGQEGHCCQATTLWKIRSQSLKLNCK
jgi:hypothetical protein